MRTLFVAGNWKMNLDGRQAVELAQALRDEFAAKAAVRLAVFPPFVYLKAVADILADSAFAVGAQNMSSELSGAFTGEVAGPMLLDVGCSCVILGHSERRHVMGEKDEFINRKLHRALDVGLEPILCVGETLEQREADQTEEVVAGQLKNGLQGVSAEQMQKVTIAYEPVWAIGTGRTAAPDQAEDVHRLLRRLLGQTYGDETAEATIIQYGGSVKPDNADALMSMPNVDGALVGGASLKADSFGGIINAAANITQ
jgi:triosephosphate isomerase